MVFPRSIAEGPPEVAPLVPVAVGLGGGYGSVAVAVRVPAPDALPPVEQWPIDAVEREHARAFGPRRQNTWIAGRVALRAAGEALGVRLGPVLPDARRAPALPTSLSGSLTHTSEWAVAWLAPADGRTRGVDLEDAARSVVKLAPTILTTEEQAAVFALPATVQNAEIVRRFALKEAIYKAIDPRYRRYVDFLEVEVWPDEGEGEGSAKVVWRLAQGEVPPQEMVLRWRRWGTAGWLCTAVASW